MLLDMVMSTLKDHLDCDGVSNNDTDSDGVCDEIEVNGCNLKHVTIGDEIAAYDEDAVEY